MITIRWLTAAGLAAGALLTAQTASASPASDALLSALNGLGLPISGDAAIPAGNLACDSSTSGFARDLHRCTGRRHDRIGPRTVEYVCRSRPLGLLPVAVIG